MQGLGSPPRVDGRWQNASMSISSPITTELLISGAVGITEVHVDGSEVYWAESRPNEGGRIALVRWSDGATAEITGPNVSVRTRVHEYGGGAWWADDGRLYYSDDARGGEVFTLDVASGTETQLTSSGYRYADGRTSADSNWFVCVRERHDGPADDPVVNEVVAVSTDGQGTELVLVSGHDFYASPRFGMGGALACVGWNHPDMPWDHTELLVVEPTWMDGDPDPAVRRVPAIDDESESIVLPGWTADGRLLAVTDRKNWWNLVSVNPETGAHVPVVEGDFEIATPGWVFGLSRWCEVSGTSTGSVERGVAGIVVVAGTAQGDTIGFPNGYMEDRHTCLLYTSPSPRDRG